MLVKAASGTLPDEMDVAVFFLQSVVAKMFKGSSLDIVEVTQLVDLLKRDYGRTHFARLLFEQKAHVRRNSMISH